MVVIDLAVIIRVDVEMHVTRLLLFAACCWDEELNVDLLIWTRVRVLRQRHLLVLLLVSELFLLVGVALHEAAGVDLFLFLFLLLSRGFEFGGAGRSFLHGFAFIGVLRLDLGVGVRA